MTLDDYFEYRLDTLDRATARRQALEWGEQPPTADAELARRFRRLADAVRRNDRLGASEAAFAVVERTVLLNLPKRELAQIHAVTTHYKLYTT